MGTDKRHSMERAKALLSEPTDETIRYVALELRMCMEYLTYEKLRAYSNIVPPEVLAIWQPPQAVKALLDFEPEAEKSFEIHVGAELVPGEMPAEMHFLGSHNALSIAWLRKHYNKLGNLLHAPNGATPGPLDIEATTKYLNEVIRDLEAPLASTILGANLRVVWSVQCSQCGKIVARNADAMKAGATATCFTPGCQTEYLAKETEDGKVVFEPVLAHLACGKCGTDIAIQPKKLAVGIGLHCPACSQVHQITGHRWSYVASEA